PAFATLSDRVGRFRVLATAAVLIALSAYPVLRYLVDHPSYGMLIASQIWLGTLYAAYASSCFVGLCELVPTRIRATGYGVSTSLGLAIFGGGTPLISTWLIQATGDSA